jgi:protein-L-isoaspartate(D-aspartate) O-methyltransferase
MFRFLSALFAFLILFGVAGCLDPAAESRLQRTSSSSKEEFDDRTSLEDDAYAEARGRMVEYGIRALGIDDPQVLDVMGRVPRHAFVPNTYLKQAYANHALPIGYGQTISQPYIVALMTQELDLEPGEKVLEVGTGSGYQAAILAELDVEVYTIEIIEALALEAEQRLSRLGYDRIHTLNADGYYGWSEYAPFDAIIVTAAPDHVPQPLLGQLREGGVMVIPVGPIGGIQELWRLTHTIDGEIESSSLGGVRFVPFTRAESE